MAHRDHIHVNLNVDTDALKSAFDELNNAYQQAVLTFEQASKQLYKMTSNVIPDIQWTSHVRETTQVIGWWDKAAQWRVADTNSMLMRMGTRMWPFQNMGTVLGMNNTYLSPHYTMFDATVDYWFGVAEGDPPWPSRKDEDNSYCVSLGDGTYVRVAMVSLVKSADNLEQIW